MGESGKAKKAFNQLQKGDLCCFCNGPAVTRDHVPPRSRFDPDNPGHLATVPACRKCNEESSKDDEYFRDHLAAAGYPHPVAKRVWKGPVLRSLDRRPAKREMLVDSIVGLDVWTKVGAYLGKVEALTREKPRVNRVLKKVVQGMFYHFGRTRLTGINVKIRQYLSDPLENLRAQLPHGWDIGKGVFKFWCGFSDKDPRLSIWWLVFYERVLFIVLTEPMEGFTQSSHIVAGAESSTAE